jgi:AcrR family transcriptional regulator
MAQQNRQAAWRRDPDLKRARIRAAARSLFLKQGYGATTTAQIACAARVSEGLLFHHFASKELLLREVASAHADGFVAAMAAAAHGDRPDVPRILRAVFAYVRTRRPVVALIAREGATLGAELHRGRVVAALAALLARWRAAGYVPDLEPQLAAEILYGAVGVALERCFVDKRPRIGERTWLRETTRIVEGALGIAAR